MEPVRRARSRGASVVELLDDDATVYSLDQWRRRNLELYRRLASLELVDLEVVSEAAFSALAETLIAFRVGAAVDPQNASHIRAQNENVIYYGLAARVPRRVLTIALVAGCFHDLNKAVGEPLRTDEFAVRSADGSIMPVMTTIAQIVGLNHLGDRTRRALFSRAESRTGGIERAVVQEIDRCIVHHGLGSSRFIRDLVSGKNAWWGAEFVDLETGRRRVHHPPQPESTLASLIHDLADSTQQMQGGATWLMKYPAGFWRGSGRSYLEMLCGDLDELAEDIPMSLRSQIDVESETCRAMLLDAESRGVIDAESALRLRMALDRAVEDSRAWVDASEESLSREDGYSVIHDLARGLGISREAARAQLATSYPGTAEGDAVEEALWASARRIERVRARELALGIEAAGSAR